MSILTYVRLLTSSNPSRSLMKWAPAQGLVCLAALVAGSAWAQTQDTVTTFTYDNMGNVKTVNRPLGRTTLYNYDTFNWISQENVTVGSTIQVTKSSYDGLGQLSSVTDPRNLATVYTVDGLGNRSQLNSPDTQGSTYTVDEAGNVLTSTDARGKTTRFQYDPLNRLTSVQYESGVPSQFEYDGGPGGPVGEIGNLTRITDESGYTVFTHDLNGRVLTKTQVVSAGGSNVQVTLQYSYGTAGPATGKLESMTYPSGARVSYRFDANGRVSSVSLNPADGTSEVPLLTNIAYTPSGAVQSWNWGTSSLQAYQRTYDLDGRLTSYPIDLLGTMRTVSYNAAGLITAYSHVGGPNPAQYDQGFSYDTADRLSGFTLGSITTTYVYDASGNRTAQTGPNVTYSYGATSNRLNSATFATPRVYSYDAGGNRTSDGLSSYTYSDRGRLAQVRGSSILNMYYNALDQRVLKTGPTGQTYYVYDERGRTVGEYSQDNVSTAETVYFGNLPIAVVKPQGYFYVLADHIDTPLVLAQSDGVTVWDWRNRDPFGNNAPTPSPVLQVYDHRFPGQIADPETGLFYNYFRDYDPQTGRYVQSDPIGLKGGINSYLYVEADPVLYFDPDGKVRQGGKTGKWWEYTDRNFQRWYHQCWKDPSGPDADRAELADAFAQWVQYGKPDGKNGCGGPPPPPAPAATCGDTCKKTATVVATGGAAYIVYRCVRMIPSLLPPFWGTIPANAVIP